MKKNEKKSASTVEEDFPHGEPLIFLKNALFKQQGIHADDATLSALFLYAQTLKKWNKVYQLTAKDSLIDIFTLHFLDCAALLKHLPATPFNFLDVGSGAGFPGMVLALFRADSSFTLIDSSSKKTAFLREVVRVLNLQNVEIVCARVEDLKGAFDFVACRAFSTAFDFVSQTRHLLSPNGKWWLMKSHRFKEEMEALSNSVKWQTQALSLADSSLFRHLCILQPK